MLNAYLTATRELLQNPPAPESLYATSDLTNYINTSRGQLAGDSESVRNYATFTLPAGARSFALPAIMLGAPSTGIQGVFNVRQIWIAIGTGQVWIRPRPWPWFSLYKLNNPAPDPGQVNVWAQFGQGVTGSIFVDPVPIVDTKLILDTVCYPVPLVDDATAEAIPYPWTDAVPFFAAYYALLSAQSAARQQDADRMFQRYQEFQNRARKISNPSILPGIYEQAGNPVRTNQLGLPTGGAGGGGG